MPEVKSKKGPENDIYDYVFNLEEEIRNLRTEKQIIFTKSMEFERELQKLKAELESVRAPPLIMGTVQELFENRAVVRNTGGAEFLIKVSPPVKNRIKIGSRVAMSQKNLAIVEILPEFKDLRAMAMEVIEKPKVAFKDIGGLENVKQELEETVVLPLVKPQMFTKLGITPPSGILLHGLPGTGKTILAKAVANQTHSTFISMSGTELVQKYIGEGGRIVRDMFKLANEKESAIIFIDEIDAIGTARYASTSGDREVQRTMTQLLSEMDGFAEKKNVKIIAATNRIDILDPALLRPGRFDRVIKVPVPDENTRKEIFKIHSAGMNISGSVDLEKISKKVDHATGADIKAICTEAGIFALRKGKSKIETEHFNKAIAKVKGKQEETLSTKEKMLH